MIKFKTFILGIMFLTYHAIGDEVFRPQTIEDVPYESVDEMVHIKDAKVAWMDIAALRRDFPGLRTFSNDQIRQWIIDEYAYISKEQLKLNGIRHTAVPTDPNKIRKGHRPKTFKRSIECETGLSSGGIVNLKGSGFPTDSEDVANQIKVSNTNFPDPRLKQEHLNTLQKSKLNGVMTHGEAIAEVTRENALRKLFDLHNTKLGTNFQTVESYFIITVPAEILRGDNQKDAMAILGRQSSIGRPNYYPAPNSIYEDHQGLKQMSIFGSAGVDQGGTIITDPRLAYNYGVEGYVPDPTIPMYKEGDNFFYNLGAGPDPQESNAWKWAHTTAAADARGETEAIPNHMSAMMRPIDDEWSKLKVAQERAFWNVPRPERAGEKIPGLFTVISEKIKTMEPWQKITMAQNLYLYKQKVSANRAEEILQLLKNDPNKDVQEAAERGLSKFRNIRMLKKCLIRSIKS